MASYKVSLDLYCPLFVLILCTVIYTPQQDKAFGYYFCPWCQAGLKGDSQTGDRNILSGLYLRNYQRYGVDNW